HGTAQVGAEHRVQPVGAAPLTQLHGKGQTSLRQLTGQPAAGDAGLVVLAYPVRLVNDLNGHRRSRYVGCLRLRVAAVNQSGSHITAVARGSGIPSSNTSAS